MCTEPIFRWMRADGSFSKPDEWWDTHPLRSIKAAESGSAQSTPVFISRALSKGIVLSIRSVKAKHANEWLVQQLLGV